MKKSITLITLLFIFSFYIKLNAQHISQNNNIVIGTLDSIQSNILNEDRKIWVNVPSTIANSTEKYPVVYLLDGDSHFSSVVGMIHQLSSINGNTTVPKMIVVGIPNTDRMRDLTPTHVKEMFPGDTKENSSGGGEKFMDFLETELIPHIEANYPTNPYRMYIGHSLGGLTVINTLLKRPELFNSYIAIDPSLWWNNSATLKEAKTILNTKNLSDESMFVGIANTMPEDMNIDTVVKDTTQTTNHIRDIIKFSKEVVPNSTSALNFNYKYYNNDTHGSVPLISTYDALRFIFSWYDLGDNIFPQIMDPTVTSESIITNISGHYAKVSKKMGCKILPPEGLINQMGYGALRQNEKDKALSFFKMNVENFPNTSNVYDSLGDYYAEVEETEKAIKAYEKALSTGGGNGYSKQKLDKLKQEN